MFDIHRILCLLSAPNPCCLFNFEAQSLSLYSLALSAFKARLMMMSAPFYKVSILTFSPCGGFFPHPTTDCETATTDRE